MRLPLIKHIVEFIDTNDQDWVHETIELLEHITEAKGIKDEELDVIGELLSNLYGALDVSQEIKNGKPAKEALNEFMRRVTGSIDLNNKKAYQEFLISFLTLEIINAYIFLLYCPPTSKSALVICPREHTLEASISSSNMFSL